MLLLLLDSHFQTLILFLPHIRGPGDTYIPLLEARRWPVLALMARQNFEMDCGLCSRHLACGSALSPRWEGATRTTSVLDSRFTTSPVGAGLAASSCTRHDCILAPCRPEIPIRSINLYLQFCILVIFHTSLLS